MWGQSLESESSEGQNPKAYRVMGVQQSDLILKGTRVQC